MGEEVDVSVAICCKDFNAAVFSEETVADREGFLFVGDVSESVGSG